MNLGKYGLADYSIALSPSISKTSPPNILVNASRARSWLATLALAPPTHARMLIAWV
jgi:hypothetical protein